MSPDSPLTLEGLAEALRRSAEATDRRFQAMQDAMERFASRADQRIEALEEQDRLFRNRIETLTGQVEALAVFMREQGLARPGIRVVPGKRSH